MDRSVEKLLYSRRDTAEALRSLRTTFLGIGICLLDAILANSEQSGTKSGTSTYSVHFSD